MLKRQKPINHMSQKRREERAAAGDTRPFSTLSAAPLNRTTEGGRFAALDRKPTKNTGPTDETVALVFKRDHNRCARCGQVITGRRGVDWSVQHRRARQGRDARPDANQPQNLLLLHGSGTTLCHGHVESFRDEAREFGWAVRQSDDPALKPVLHAVHGWVLLTPAGGFTAHSPNHTEVPA
ncbi:hypothetical protein [Micromonospora sp. NPDC050695]|uniref:hypothetical protein n=1 Tax=Micromonospora sp. NPDC050695 TaxID=3154938 RepID=UPI00340AC88F